MPGLRAVMGGGCGKWRVAFKVSLHGKQWGFLWMLLEVGHSTLLGAGMNSNRATSHTFYLPSHGDENIPVGERCSQKVLTQPERWEAFKWLVISSQMVYLFLPQCFSGSFQTSAKSLSTWYSLKSHLKGEEKSPKLFEKDWVIWAADVLVKGFFLSFFL